MEERPLFPKPEDEEESDEQPKKKLPSLAELLIKRDEAQEDEDDDPGIVDSLIENLKAEPASLDDQTETISNQQEQSFELSLDEEVYVSRAIAEEHLANPVVSEQPSPPVTEFLELVVGGVEPDTAFGATKIAHQLEVPSQPEPAIAEAEVSVAENEAAPLMPTSSVNITAEAAPVVKLEPKLPPNKSRQPVVPKLATKLSTAVSQRRSQPPIVLGSEKVIQLVNHNDQPQLERRVAEVEASITKQEQTLQDLSQQKVEAPVKAVPSNDFDRMQSDISESRINLSQQKIEAPVKVEPPNSFDRLQPGISESRLNLSKPEERAGHIGKMLVNKERVSAERHKPKAVVSPDQVKSMRRPELLELSSGMLVEGASLKHMFESNLFDENALRRLVAAKLKGQNVLPLLRREILDRQNDFERDPSLRKRSTQTSTNISMTGSDELFNKMLGSSEKTPEPSLTKPMPDKTRPISNSAYPSEDNSPRAQTKTLGMPIANALLGVIIALLIGLILFFSLR